MTNFDLQVDFRTVAIARVIQAVGMAFLFVPINTAAYAFLPREKNNAASGLMTWHGILAAVWAFLSSPTLLDRRTQGPHHDLVSHISASNPAFRSTLQGPHEPCRPMVRARLMPPSRLML